MNLSEQQKYNIALQEAKIKKKKREMFLQPPNSVTHAIKVIAYDLLRTQLLAMKRVPLPPASGVGNGAA